MAYPGSSTNLARRLLDEHLAFSPIYRKKRSNLRLQRSLTKRGPLAFLIVIAELILQKKNEQNETYQQRLLAAEQVYLDTIPRKFFYNFH